MMGMFSLVTILFVSCGDNTSVTPRSTINPSQNTVQTAEPTNSAGTPDVPEEDTDEGKGFFVGDKDKDILGEPEHTLDPKAVYQKLTYTPEMFYGDYKLPGGDEAVAQYCQDVGYMDFELEYGDGQLTQLPYRITSTHVDRAIAQNEGIQLLHAFFRTNEGTSYYLYCSYDVVGNTIILKPFRSWDEDKENYRLAYTYYDMELVYEFQFKGRSLTLSKDGKSVKLESGLSYNGELELDINGYYSGDAEPIEGFDQICIFYCESTKFIHLGNRVAYIRAAAQVYDNGLITISFPQGNEELNTVQFVYFICSDGIILTDGDTTYYYNDGFYEYNKKQVASYIGEEDSSKFEKLTETQQENIVEKKSNLIDDLVAAFAAAGINVTVNEKTGELAMDASVLFGGDSSVLTAEGEAFLQKFITAYTGIAFSDKYDGFIKETRVEGHSAPLATSTYESGLPLSQARADAVKDYCLSGKSGISSGYISRLSGAMNAIGMSNSVPIYDAQGNVDLDASRRVSFRFIINID